MSRLNFRDGLCLVSPDTDKQKRRKTKTRGLKKLLAIETRSILGVFSSLGISPPQERDFFPPLLWKGQHVSISISICSFSFSSFSTFSTSARNSTHVSAASRASSESIGADSGSNSSGCHRSSF